jgi:hypothetical protein
MGTSTIFIRFNDLKRDFASMTKKELKELDKLSPHGEKKESFGISAQMELHNGNIHSLVWWKGRLFRLEDAPTQLTRKYYSKWKGKEMREYEWTLFKKYLENEIECLDKKFKKIIRRKRREETNSLLNKKPQTQAIL